jgi:hypothetical protein
MADVRGYDRESGRYKKITRTVMDEGTDDEKWGLDVYLPEGAVTLEATDLEIGSVELKDATTDQRASIDTYGSLKSRIAKSDGTVISPATEGTLTALTYQPKTALTDQSFSFAASDPANTTKILEFTAPDNPAKEYLITLYNPSTETNVRMQVKNLLSSFGGYTRPAKLDEHTYSAQPARINPTKVYYYDASGTSYSDETTDFTNATANDVAIPGHAEAEVGDILYIGYTNRFRKVYINIGTQKTDVSTLVTKYYNGSTWATLSDIATDGVAGSLNFAAATGVHEYGFHPPINWAATTVNGTSAYWVAVECTAFTSAGTQGQITQGNIVDNINSDIEHYNVYGLFNQGDVRLVLSNGTQIGASVTVAGAGAFTGYVRISPI